MEIPKLLDCQTATWYDNKHYHTIKFLVGILPSTFSTFLS